VVNKGDGTSQGGLAYSLITSASSPSHEIVVAVFKDGFVEELELNLVTHQSADAAEAPAILVTLLERSVMNSSFVPKDL